MILTSRKRQFSRPAVMMVLGALLVAVSGRTVAADNNDDETDQRLAGAWTVQVTLRSCETNAPMGSFTSLVTFHHGGTLTETSGSTAFQPGQRTEGHGAWKRVSRTTFSQHVIVLLRFDSPANLPGTPTFDPSQPISPGFSAGWQTISHRVRLTGADTFESSGTTEFFDTSGQSYRPGCSTAVGRRFE